jgi:3-deoxy-D-manno-octulosonic-acid transferase
MLSLIYFFYSLLLGLAMLLTSPYWLYQALRHGKYHAGFWERMGRVHARLRETNSQRVIWVHAVSLGEVLAVSGLIEAMRRGFPGHRVLISTTTDTGQAIARKRFGENDVFYFPMDFAFAVRSYLRALRPELIVLAETEFWPNFLRLAHASGANVAVVNARISDRSWPKYRRFRVALKRMLAQIDLFLPQTEQDSERLQAMGAPSERVRVTGNLKFDVALPSPPAIVETLRASLSAESAGPVLVCGSTVEGEEPVLLRAFQNVRAQHPRAVMILAPRHPERFDGVANLVAQTGLPFCRRSQWHGESLATGVLLLDSLGELAALYAVADIAFVGGSLIPHGGGHNIIEPAQHGVAIVTGTEMKNFRDVVAQFQNRDAVRVVTPSELGLTFARLLANDAERQALGQRAQETVRSQMGATARTMEALQILLTSESASVSAKAAHNH